MESRDTLELPAASRCTIASSLCRGALHAPGTPLILRRVYDKTPGREESCALFGQAQRQPKGRGFWWWLIAMGFVVRILRVGETLAVR
jgi:hypothetical protein